MHTVFISDHQSNDQGYKNELVVRWKPNSEQVRQVASMGTV